MPAHEAPAVGGRHPTPVPESAPAIRLSDSTVSVIVNPYRDAALDYAGRNWPVFPCGRDKTPLTEHGWMDATTDSGLIDRWWLRYPLASVAIATGPAGLAVLDADPRHGGHASLQQLILDHGPEVYDTLRALSGSGGDHLYFDRPAGLDIRNSAGRLGPGLDVRAIGGYIIAPPPQRPRERPAL